MFPPIERSDHVGRIGVAFQYQTCGDMAGSDLDALVEGDLLNRRSELNG